MNKGISLQHSIIKVFNFIDYAADCIIRSNYILFNPSVEQIGYGEVCVLFDTYSLSG